MIVDAEFLDSLDTAVDQSQSVLLATGEDELGQASIVDASACGAVACAIATCKIHLSVDQVIVRWWSDGILVREVSPHHALKYGKVVPVVVVVKRYGAKIDVICMMRWTVYYLLRCQN